MNTIDHPIDSMDQKFNESIQQHNLKKRHINYPAIHDRSMENATYKYSQSHTTETHHMLTPPTPYTNDSADQHSELQNTRIKIKLAKKYFQVNEIYEILSD
jgi:hypothetical protein